MRALKLAKWKVILVAAVAVLALFAIVIAWSTPREVPFDRATWIASPATNRWIYENVRYQMANGAAKAAQTCRGSYEVFQLLGSPEGSSDYARGGTDSDPQHSFDYWLGRRRHPILFWESASEVQLEVVFDRKGRVIEAVVRESRS